MTIETGQSIFIFPLNTVLYPDGVLPLKIFEQRYLDMTKACLRDKLPFGVCLIREGPEVGAAAVPEQIGCLATIEHWDMQQLGVFQLLTRGGTRFRIREMKVAPNHLISATVDPIAEGAACKMDGLCREVLQAVIEKVGAERFPSPMRLDDAAWVGYRLAEILPLDTRVRQQLLELPDTAERLARLRMLIEKQGLGV